MSPPRLLLVEDDVVSARSFARLLHAAVERQRWEHPLEVTVVASRAEAEHVIAGPGALAAVWSDRHLAAPDDGCRVLVAARAAHPQAVLMLVTGTVDAPGLEALPSRVAVFEKTRAHEAVDWVVGRLRARP